jgi:hypothetical protein
MTPQRSRGKASTHLVSTEAGDVRLPLGQPSGKIVHSLLDGIDVPGGNSHDDGYLIQIRIVRVSEFNRP